MRNSIGKLIGVATVSIATWFLATFALSGRVLAQQQETAGITLDTIVGKWKERDKQIESFVFVCDGEHFEVASFMARRASPQDNVPDDVSHRHRRFVLSKDARNRFEEDGRVWDPDKAAYVPTRTIAVFDGKSRNILFVEDRYENPHAFMDSRAGDTFGKDLRNLPIRMALCPFRNGIREFSPEALVLTDERATIDHQEVLVLKSGRKKVWVDPAKDFLPVKREDEFGGFVNRVMEISYAQDKTYGWIPSAWTASLLNQEGKITWRDTATVSEFSINKPIDDSEFKLALPAGTSVTNYAK
jgi:hypothetical protein